MKQPGRKSAAALATVPAQPPAVPRRSDLQPAPAHLSDAAASFWRSTVAEYDLGPHHLLLLATACEQIDLIAAAREAVAAHGSLTIEDPHGRTTAHPAVAIQRNGTIALSRILRELNLDTSEGFAFDRPPPIRSNRN